MGLSEAENIHFLSHGIWYILYLYGNVIPYKLHNLGIYKLHNLGTN